MFMSFTHTSQHVHIYLLPYCAIMLETCRIGTRLFDVHLYSCRLLYIQYLKQSDEWNLFTNQSMLAQSNFWWFGLQICFMSLWDLWSVWFLCQVNSILFNLNLSCTQIIQSNCSIQLLLKVDANENIRILLNTGLFRYATLYWNHFIDKSNLH